MASRQPSLMLTAPSTPLFAISVIVALATVISHYGHVAIPVVSAHEFDAMVLAFAVLTAGVLMRGA